ncbi:hypothetical protein POL68_37935 [Stigmatella sp. ncwal1]|uniref:Uncharacterized protein n=1 Tax=Stigmatella ashevillensis TaxID=2995309 RepID=A0ABT5DNH7_9BACT|nr:hypothetical protein [Stigmatella ashevillena]MDC0714303.1 hypothetical protein [Stigmatella ashevillena]
MSRTTRIVASLAVLLAAGASLAQSPRAPGVLPPAPTRAPLEKASEVPDPDKLQRSAQALGIMRGVLTEVQLKLTEARGTKDMVKVNCVNEKLTQTKGLLRISEQADVALQEAVARRDSTSSEHEYTKVMIARQKVSQLSAETEECIGQLLFRTDENLSVEVEEPRDLPGGDPTQPRTPPDVIARPPPASPTL